MPQAARYLFDLDFSAPPEPEVKEEIEEIPPEPMITVAEHERLLAQAVAAARAEGEAEALQQRERLASEESLSLQQTMFDEISMIYTEVGTLLQRLEKDASNLAFAFASRFAERLVAQEPKTEILALLHQILAPLRKAPHISIRLNEDVADDIKEMVDHKMQELGFTGKLTIIPDPAMMAGDCEVEWADGGIGRNLRSAIRQVDQLLEDHFAHVPEPEDDDDETDDETDQDVKADAESDAPSASQEQREISDLKGEASPEQMPVETDTQQGQTEDLIPTEQPIDAETDPSMTAQPTLDPELPAATGPTQMETNNE
nr:FliH/SctL family protein [uncultured Cohaesibacter sp.]